METTIEYLGHSVFEITSERGIKILVDPYITGNSMCPMKVEDFKGVNLILVTHGARDHLGDAIQIARNNNSVIICGPDVRYFARKSGIPADKVRVLVWGGVIEEAGIKIRAVEARHCSFVTSSEKEFIGNIPLSFIVYTETGNKIYHMGDTSIFSDMRLFGNLYAPHILCIGVGKPRGYFSEMSPFEAALATQWVRPRIVIPMHYEDGSDDPKKFEECVKMMSDFIEVKIMKPGETLKLNYETVRNFRE